MVREPQASTRKADHTLLYIIYKIKKRSPYPLNFLTKGSVRPACLPHSRMIMWQIRHLKPCGKHFLREKFLYIV